MLETITRRLRRDRRGVSNVIVVMLSLVLVVIVVSNVILWSYQMNQLDLERSQESVTVSNVTRVTRSSWFTAQNEYMISAGSRVSGSFTDTESLDGLYETFKTTTSGIYRLDISNTFVIDLSTHQLGYIHGVEILVRYNATEEAETWFLRAYNWTASSFSDVGFNNTQGNQPILNAWNDYAVNVTDKWADYVSGNGTLLLKFLDEGSSMDQTIVEIDFLAVRAIVDGARFDIRNSSPLTIHIVAIWIANSTKHQRFEASLFINSGEEATYIRYDVKLPAEDFITKVATERGNIAVFP